MILRQVAPFRGFEGKLADAVNEGDLIPENDGVFRIASGDEPVGIVCGKKRFPHGVVRYGIPAVKLLLKQGGGNIVMRGESGDFPVLLARPLYRQRHLELIAGEVAVMSPEVEPGIIEFVPVIRGDDDNGSVIKALFLQKGKDYSLVSATEIIAFSEAFGIAGTVLAGWLSDRVFKGNRFIPVLLSGMVCLASLAGFLLTKGSYVMNIVYVATFSLSIGVVYCTVAGLMALDIVPRKATGSALGMVGLASYAAAGIQNVISGFMIGSGDFNFRPVSVFWLVACLLSFMIPVLSWRLLKRQTI